MNIARLSKTIFLYICCFQLFSCATSLIVKNTRKPVLSNPRAVAGELVVKLIVREKFDGPELGAWNVAHDIPSEQPPQLRFWSAAIREYQNQKNIHNVSIEPEPTDRFPDPENGNHILYWDFSPHLTVGDTIVIKRRFSYSTYDFAPKINPDSVMVHWPEIPADIKTFYTKPERSLEQTTEMTDTIRTIIGNETNPFRQARLIYDWVQNYMTYVYPPENRGAIPAFESGEGDCGQYSALFISLCRIAGIPARQQSGFNFLPERTGYHVWSEIFLPPYGWVPMDATRDNGFNFIDNKRLIASVGMNIPLQHVPNWSTYKYQEAENGRTDFMQLFTLVFSGIELDIETEMNVIESTTGK